MANSRAVEAGRAFLRLLVDDKQFARGFDRALAKVQAFGRGLGMIGRQMGRTGLLLSARSLRRCVYSPSKLRQPESRCGGAVDSIKTSAIAVASAIGEAVLPTIQKFAAILRCEPGGNHGMD